MGHSPSSVRLGGLIAALSFLSILAAMPAPAFSDLPRTYQVQRLDSPNPLVLGRYSRGMHLAGDVNNDGEEDLAMPNNPPNGQIFLISGETGALLDTVNAPDPSTAGADAGFGAFGNKAGQSRTAPPFNDLGSCPGGVSGVICGNPHGRTGRRRSGSSDGCHRRRCGRHDGRGPRVCHRRSHARHSEARRHPAVGAHSAGADDGIDRLRARDGNRRRPDRMRRQLRRRVLPPRRPGG